LLPPKDNPKPPNKNGNPKILKLKLLPLLASSFTGGGLFLLG